RLALCATVRAVAHRVAGLEQVDGRIDDAVLHLVERRDVVKDPERAAVRSGHQVGALDHQVPDGSDGQVGLQPLPVGAVVEGYEDAALGPAKQQTAAVRVLTNDTRELVVGDAAGDCRPTCAVV